MPKSPPVMPLHVQAFLHGTEHLTNEELGAYTRLLLHQWEYEHVPADNPSALAALLHESSRRAARLWHTIRAKFVQLLDGRWVNPRCEHERARAVENATLQAARARQRWRSCE